MRHRAFAHLTSGIFTLMVLVWSLGHGAVIAHPGIAALSLGILALTFVASLDDM